MIQRTVLKKLKELYKQPDILALVGARRVGKTTLMKLLYEKESKPKEFMSFDDHEILRLFEENIKEFAKLYEGKILFIDEFQYSKNGGKKLKYLYDLHNFKIIISGSSAPELTIQSLNYLVGRVFVVEIPPISFEEYIKYKDDKLISLIKNITTETLPLIKPYFEEYLTYGGYPQVILEKTPEEKKQRLKQIVDTYLLKEIRDILQFKDSVLFEKLLKLLALEHGSMVNKSKLSSLLGISIPKLNEMLDVLTKTYVISLIKPYKNSKIKQLIKTPKLYFLDNGFRNTLLDNFKEINYRADKGFVYEGFILHSLLYKEKDVLFYNYKNSSEVDFLVDEVAIEVKSNLTKPKIERGMYSFLDKYSPKDIIVYNENVFEKEVFNEHKVNFKHFIEIFNIF